MRFARGLVWLMAVSTVACGSPEPPVPPLLGAVGFEGANLVLLNRDTRAFEGLTLTINDSYSTTADHLAAGGKLAIPAVNFANASGQRLNVFTTKPLRFGLTATVNGQPMTWQTPFSYATP